MLIKAFFGTSENAVKSQIWIAVSVYVLVAIVKKRFKLSARLYQIRQILRLTGRSTDDNRIVVRPIFSVARTDIACTNQREASCHALADLVGGKHVQNVGKIRGHARGPGSGRLRQCATRRPGDGKRATVRECGAQ